MDRIVCGLTFELKGRNRNGAWPAMRMMTASASRAKCHAGGGPAPVKGWAPLPRRGWLVNHARLQSCLDLGDALGRFLA